MSEVNEVLIRQGTKEDCPHAAALIKRLADTNGYEVNWLNDKEKFIEDASGESPWYFFKVAESNVNGEKAIVGFAMYYFCFSIRNGRNVYLAALYVVPECQHGGVGTKLLRAVAQAGVDKLCQTLLLTCFSWNKKAVAFYKKHGGIDYTEKTDSHFVRLEKEDVEKLALSNKFN